MQRREAVGREMSGVRCVNQYEGNNKGDKNCLSV